MSVISYDYGKLNCTTQLHTHHPNSISDFSPYGQKIRLVLAAAGVQWLRVDQPVVLPRPDLTNLGITYRRIPILAVGKDVYADTSLIVDKIVSTLGKIPTSPADKAYETWGNNLFQEVLSLIPMAALTPEFVKDRLPIFPGLNRPDIKTLRPSGLGSFKQRLREVEDQFLASGGPFINGSQLSLADLHIGWVLRWTFKNLGVENDQGVGKAEFPKVWKFIESLPETPHKDISADEAAKLITGGQYTAKGADSVQANDALELKAGTEVTVESSE